MASNPQFPDLNGKRGRSLHHYLLDEPNLPAGHVPTIAPYDSADPANTPAQVIFPAHRIPFAHSSTIWSLDWHPLGHILATGSKDNFTRFWSRARPGETNYLKDRFHIGEEAAEAQGTWSRGFGRRQMREEEEQELQDEAEGLIDQKRPTESILPGIHGLPNSDSASGQGSIPGIGTVQPPPQPPPGISSSLPQIDPSRLAAVFTTGSFPSHQGTSIQQNLGPQAFPLPGIPGGLPPNLNLSALQQKLFSQQIAPQQNVPPQNGGYMPSGILGLHGGGNEAFNEDFSGAGRKRGPLPSQHDSLIEEQRKGNWRNAR